MGVEIYLLYVNIIKYPNIFLTLEMFHYKQR